MKISIQQMRYLLATVSAGSITDASKALSVSQGTLSEALSQIENEVGFKLFRRKRKPVVLTDEGEDFLGYARGVVKKMDALEARFGPEQRKINFAVSSLPFRFTINSLGKLAGTPGNEGYEFTIETVPLSKLVQDVASGARDFGVLYLTNDNEIPMTRVFENSGVEFHHLFDTKPYILIDPKHELANRTSVTYEDLKVYPKFLFSQYLYTGAASQACDPHLPIVVEREGGQIQMTSTLSLGEIVSSFAGINGFMIWCDLVPEETNPEDLVSVPIETDDRMKIGYLKPCNTELSDIERQYVDALMRYANK